MRRCSPSPGRRRRPRQEDGARLTPAGRAAARQLPPPLVSTRSAATHTSSGELGGSASLGRQRENGLTSGRRCCDQLAENGREGARRRGTGARLAARATQKPGLGRGGDAPLRPESRPGTHAVKAGSPAGVRSDREKYTTVLRKHLFAQ